MTCLANRKDMLLWGPDLSFSFPAAVCGQQLIVSTCFTSGITSGGDKCHKRTFFFFNGHFLSGVTCMTACDKQKLMGTLLCQYLLNCFDTGCRLPAWPPSQDLTWNVARGPQALFTNKPAGQWLESWNNAVHIHQEKCFTSSFGLRW